MLRRWIGSLKRNSPWTTSIIEGKLEGKPGRRRPRTPFMKKVMEDDRISRTHEVVHGAKKNHEQQRKMKEDVNR